MQAMAFCLHVLKLDVVKLVGSTRLAGASLTAMRKLGFRKQSKDLDAWLVEMWEIHVARRALG